MSRGIQKPRQRADMLLKFLPTDEADAKRTLAVFLSDDAIAQLLPDWCARSREVVRNAQLVQSAAEAFAATAQGKGSTCMLDLKIVRD